MQSLTRRGDFGCRDEPRHKFSCDLPAFGTARCEHYLKMCGLEAAVFIASTPLKAVVFIASSVLNVAPERQRYATWRVRGSIYGPSQNMQSVFTSCLF